MIRDFNVEWLEKRVFIPVWQFQSWATIAPTSGGVNGAGAGTTLMTEIGTTGLTGSPVIAAGNSWAHIWEPNELDITKQLRFRVVYTQSSTTATDTVDWIVTYTPLVTETTVIVDPVTALTTPIPLADASSGVANVIQASDFGRIARNTIPQTTDFITFKVEADAIGTYSTNEIFLLGLEIRYTPRRTAGPRRNILGGRRLLTTRPLGVQLATAQEGL